MVDARLAQARLTLRREDLGTLGIAATVDMGQQRPDSFIVRKLVGDDILVNVYGDRAFSGSNGAAGFSPRDVRIFPQDTNAFGGA